MSHLSPIKLKKLLKWMVLSTQVTHLRAYLQHSSNASLIKIGCSESKYDKTE